jgi:hypothetical protein
MTEELDYETLERFALAVESWPPEEAQKEYDRMVAEEMENRSRNSDREKIRNLTKRTI